MGLMLLCLIAVVAQALPGTYLIETADEKGEDNVAPLGRDYHNVAQFGGGWGHHNVVQFGRDYSEFQRLLLRKTKLLQEKIITMLCSSERSKTNLAYSLYFMCLKKKAVINSIYS